MTYEEKSGKTDGMENASYKYSVNNYEIGKVSADRTNSEYYTLKKYTLMTVNVALFRIIRMSCKKKCASDFDIHYSTWWITRFKCISNNSQLML